MDTRDVVVDFRADPDGEWDYDTLLEAAGFDKDAPSVRVGALCANFEGHSEGAAVVSEIDGDTMTGRYFAIIEFGEPISVPRVGVQPVALTAGWLHVLPSAIAQASAVAQDTAHVPSRAA
jgi:hypothetical protein